MSGLLIAMAAALTGPALHDEPAVVDDPPPPPETGLEVSFLPGAWIPRMVGEVALGGGEIQVNDEFELNKNEATLNLELALRKDDFWELWFGGFDFSSNVSGLFRGDGRTFGGLALNNGDPYNSEFEMTSVATDLSVAIWRPYAEGHSHGQGGENRNWEGRPIIDLRFCPQFGMRYVDVDHTVTTAGGTERGGGEWLAVYAGLLIEVDYRPQQRLSWLSLFRIQGSFALGPALGGDGGSMWQVRAGITTQFTETWGIMIGYRLVELNADNAGYTLNGGLQGLFLSGSIRF